MSAGQFSSAQQDDVLAQLNGHLAQRSESDEVDAGLLPVFLEEADELLAKIALGLDSSDQAPLRRLLHTLKGSARMAGVLSISQIAHQMEERLHDEAAAQADFANITRLLDALRNEFVDGGAANSDERFYRTVWQAAKETGREVHLELVGIDTGQLLTAPIEHLLRNAVVHGIESPLHRIACGKPPVGEVRIEVGRVGNEIVIELADDGRGLDLAALRTRAVSMGVLREADGLMDDNTLAQLIFIPGLSTAGEITQLAGRGIGMDVVKNCVEERSGRISVSSVRGQGTTFTLYLPGD
ncbi:Hpt domain-containing protein [Gallionella capsiferriformans]|uniref:Chemotaxis protein CheA n=1 Tax=Gallionella capsiferriformans (strain ES-2) TaxID=395494 RepID=D9SIC2_GALCS|nr:Hpt domain-containing protein [Gallionella capsiferriformans]ADL54179.1 CheA signal transduction histidine kinase [Gallionella capsiferriformans ES-2]